MKTVLPGRYAHRQVSQQDSRIICPGCRTKLPRLEVGQSVKCPRCKFHIKRVTDHVVGYDRAPVMFDGRMLPDKTNPTKPLTLVDTKPGANSDPAASDDINLDNVPDDDEQGLSENIAAYEVDDDKEPAG